jgi:hypothetical protein
MVWDHWNWLERGLLPLLVAVLRTFWLWPWLELLRYWLAPSQPGPLLPLLLTTGLYLAGLATMRRALTSSGSLIWMRLGVAVIGLAAIFGVLWWRFYRGSYDLWPAQWLSMLGMELTHWGQEAPAEAIALSAGAYLWWQGLRDGRASLYWDEIWAAFTLGFLGLAFAAIIVTATGNTISLSLSNLTLLYFAAGLAALALATVHTTHYDFIERTKEARLTTNRYWFVSVFSVIAALLMVGLALSALITPEVVAQSLGWVAVILDLLWAAFYYVLLVSSFLTFLVLAPLLNGLRWLLTGAADPAGPIQLADLSWDTKDWPQNTLTLPPGLGEVVRWGGLGILLVGLGIIFALALRRFWTGSDEEIDESREMIFSADLLRAQLLAWWRKRLRQLKRRPGPALNPFLVLDGEIQPRREVRAIYQMFLKAAIERGQPRQPGQTPHEYEHTWAATLPEGQRALNDLTKAYLQARYAPDPLELQEVEYARRAWAELQALFAAQDRGKDGSDET